MTVFIWQRSAENTIILSKRVDGLGDELSTKFTINYKPVVLKAIPWPVSNDNHVHIDVVGSKVLTKVTP